MAEETREARVTIGVLARAPVAGRCKRRLVPVLGTQGAADLYEAMMLDTLDALGRVGAESAVVLAAPEDDGVAQLRRLAPPSWEVVAQHGETLNERLAHAFGSLGRKGEAVVLCDSDSPTIPLAPLAPALSTFSGHKRALMGPCDDGGCYLLGMTEPIVGVLREIPWGTPEALLRARERCFELEVSVLELPTWYGVDDPPDLERLRGELANHPERAPRTAERLGGRLG
jgi:rSAM/selenodomain-associated transferase 1